MAIVVETYPDPTDPTTPLTDAYAWVFHVHLNMGLGTYWVEVWIHKSEAAASVFPPPPPLARLTINAGDEIVPATETEASVVAPSLQEVFERADAVKAANPSLTTLECLRTVVYEFASEHYLLSPGTVA